MRANQHGFKKFLKSPLPLWVTLTGVFAIITGRSQVYAAEGGDECQGPTDDCVAIGRWNFSVALGAGVRTNPLVNGKDIPLIVIPQVSYYGKRFFIDNLDLGFTLIEKGSGDKKWVFDARIKPRSQIYALAEAFRKMAARIDGLIASHKDMSNAVSHEIKTPLSRMQFEIELAQQAQTVSEVKASLRNIQADIRAIDDLVSATLNYAILERADLSLNIGTHNFTTLLPAITEFVQKDVRPDIRICTELTGDTDKVICDLHLIETVVKNLLYNAARYAKHQVHLAFANKDGVNQLLVEDDGPGIPEKDRQRVFDSFVQLESTGPNKTGFGLGLAIVKRVIEWHNGEVLIAKSPLGGPAFLPYGLQHWPD